nr:MAG TPA: hypothetical protein [Caudoviricetes sp.]
MKTEQEQRRAIRQILFDANDICQATPCENEYCIYHGDYRCYDNVIVDKLIRAGYGDVSEYKAEIERLKTEFKQLETNAEILASGVRDLNHENYVLTKKVKQAQIDVLNRLKVFSEPYPNSWGIYVVDVYHIDELIKEVENETV